ADELDADVAESSRDIERAFTTDSDHRLDVLLFQVAENLWDTVVAVRVLLEWCRSARPEDRAAEVEDSADALTIQPFVDRWIEEPAPALADTHHLVAVLVGAAHHRAHDGVEAGTVSAASQHRDLGHHPPPGCGRQAPLQAGSLQSSSWATSPAISMPGYDCPLQRVRVSSRTHVV